MLKHQINKKRAMLTLICILLMILSLFSYGMSDVHAENGDEVTSPKKIISIVYDDSGSMEGDPWGYANYATQAMAAMLNKHDQLFISYINNKGKSVEYDLSNIERTIKSIHDWRESGGTSPEAMDSARAQLDSCTEYDPSTQYWLVIMTDGQFDGYSNAEDTRNKINGFVGNTMPNGSKLNVIYFAMGKDAFTLKGDRDNGFYAYASENNSQISSEMNDIANLISGRIEVNSAKQLDDNTISFQSKLPLYSISVLSQQSSARISSANSNGTELNVTRNVGIDAKNLAYADMDLFANVGIVNHEDKGDVSVIPPGECTITFSEAVDLSNLIIQYEPAIKLNVVIDKDGKEISDTTKIKVNDTLNVKVIPVNPETNQEIIVADLPEGTAWGIEYLINDVSEMYSDKGELRGITVKEGENKIVATFRIPGFSPNEIQQTFTVRDLHLSITTEPDTPLTFNRSGKDNGGKNIRFTIFDGDKSMSADEQDENDVLLKIGKITLDNDGIKWWLKGFKNIKCTLKRESDGTYVLTPEASFIGAWAIKSGDYTVEVYIEGNESICATGKISVIPRISDLLSFIYSLGILLLMAYIIKICCKYKFRGQTVIIESFIIYPNGSVVRDNGTASSEKMPLRGSRAGHLLDPFKKECYCKWEGLILRATRNGKIKLDGESLANVADSFVKSREYLENIRSRRDIEMIKVSMNKTKDDKGMCKTKDQVLDASIFYVTPEEYNRVYCIYIIN